MALKTHTLSNMIDTHTHTLSLSFSVSPAFLCSLATQKLSPSTCSLAMGSLLKAVLLSLLMAMSLQRAMSLKKAGGMSLLKAAS